MAVETDDAGVKTLATTDGSEAFAVYSADDTSLSFYTDDTAPAAGNAQHIASAIIAGCDYFLSTDDRLLKYMADEIIVMNPIDFIKNMEEEKNGE